MAIVQLVDFDSSEDAMTADTDKTES